MTILFSVANDDSESLHGPTRTGMSAVDGPQALAKLVANRASFLGFLEQRVGDPALAEDILQEAFARCVDKLEALRQSESAVAWFYRLLPNSVTDHFRRQAATGRKLESLASELVTLEQPNAEPRAVGCQCVGRLAATLRPEHGEALSRVTVDGVSVNDYAKEVGITNNNAAVRLFRARDALRRRVLRSCGACAASGCIDCTCDQAR